MRIERCRVTHGVEFRLVGELRGIAGRQIERMLAGAVCDGSIVTLDLTEVECCDEASAKLLVSLTHRAHLAGGALGLRSVPADVLEAFDRAAVRSNLRLIDETDNGTAGMTSRRDGWADSCSSANVPTWNGPRPMIPARDRC